MVPRDLVGALLKREVEGGRDAVISTYTYTYNKNNNMGTSKLPTCLPVYLSTCLRTYLCDKRSSDDVPHDLVGALKDLVHTYVTHVPLHLVVVQVPVAVWEVVMLHV